MWSLRYMVISLYGFSLCSHKDKNNMTYFTQFSYSGLTKQILMCFLKKKNEMASVSDMQRILEKLGFGALTEHFIDQRITPDMVCKLSLYEFYQLGLHNPSEIMTLGIECMKYGTAKPARSYEGIYAVFEIPKEVLECFLE